MAWSPSLNNTRVEIDGKELRVTHIDFTFDSVSAFQRNEVEVMLKGVISRHNIEIDKNYCSGLIDNNLIKEREVCECERPINDSSVVKQVMDLELSDDDRLLRKYGVKREDGTITPSGKELLLNIVFNEYVDEVISKLRELEKTEVSKGKK